MNVYRLLSRFIQAHLGCGSPRGKAEPPVTDGYLLWIDCPCGATFERWVTSQHEDEGLLRSALVALENSSPPIVLTGLLARPLRPSPPESSDPATGWVVPDHFVDRGVR